MKIPALLLLALLPLTASAATKTWDGGGADDNWATTANWNPDGAPANGDDLTFGLGVPVSTSNNLTGRTFGLLSFLRGTTVAGNAFTLTGGVDANPLTGGNAIVTANLTLGANQTFNVDRSALELNGSVGFGSRVLTVTGGGALVFNGLAGSSTAGAKLIKNGNGRLTVEAAAIVFMPAMDFTAGTLQVLGSLQTTVNMTGGKLTGDGQLTGLNATAGDIEPAAAGLRVAGNTTLSGTARCLFHLAAAGVVNSLDVTSGSVTLNGASLVLDVTGVTPPNGASYQLLSKTSSGAVSGTFAGMPEGTEIQVGSSIGRLSYTGGNGNDIVLTIISATQTWDGGATLNDNWNDPQNWLSNTAPASGDVLIFPDGIDATDRGMDNNFPNDTVFRQLVFNGDDYTVRGNRFKLSHGILMGPLVASGVIRLNSSVSLTQDQTLAFPSIDDPPNVNTTADLEVDALAEIDLSGHMLSLSGDGGIAGRITGSGGVTILPSAFLDDNHFLHGNNDYSGESIIEAGANLEVRNQAALGSSLGRTRIHGDLVVCNSFGVGTFDVKEPFALGDGGSVTSIGFINLFLFSETEFSGPIELLGGSAGIRSATSNHRITGPISGTGSLTVEGDWAMKGTAANTFTGSLRINRGLVTAEKNGGILVVSCDNLFLSSEDIQRRGILHTDADEQIADSCHVHVENFGRLVIGNPRARTETIRALTFTGISQAFGADDSLLVITEAVNVGSGGGSTAGDIDSVDLQVAGHPTVFNVAATNPAVNLITQPSTNVTATAGASLRKTGAGTLWFQGGAQTILSVPIELAAGILAMDVPSTVSPVTLSGGHLSATKAGLITSLAGGGILEPGPFPGNLGTLQSGAVSLNAATTLRIKISNAAPGAGHDQVQVAGSVALGGARLEIEERPDFVVVGANLTIIANDGSDAVSGTFAGLPEGGFIPVTAAHGGGGFTISYHGGDGNDVVLDRAQTPPPDAPPAITGFSVGPADVNGNRTVTITGTGAPGVSHRLEVSANLSQWMPTGAAQSAAANTGALNFSVTASPAVRPKEFYRLRRL